MRRILESETSPGFLPGRHGATPRNVCGCATILQALPCDRGFAASARLWRKTMGKFSITWQETYEMTAEIKADTYEEAMRKAAGLMDGAPTLEFLDAWQAGGEDSEGVSTRFMDETIEAELAFSQGPFCVPLLKEQNEDGPPRLEWPSEQRSS